MHKKWICIVPAAYTRIDDGEGVGTGRSKLQLTLSRGDLNARFECRVESDALDEPIISWISADVHGKYKIAFIIFYYIAYSI